MSRLTPDRGCAGTLVGLEVLFAASLVGLGRGNGSEVLILVCGMCANDADDAELERRIIASIRPATAVAAAPAEDNPPAPAGSDRGRAASAAAETTAHTGSPPMAAAHGVQATEAAWVGAAAKAWVRRGQRNARSTPAASNRRRRGLDQRRRPDHLHLETPRPDRRHTSGPEVCPSRSTSVAAALSQRNVTCRWRLNPRGHAAPEPADDRAPASSTGRLAHHRPHPPADRNRRCTAPRSVDPKRGQ